MSRSCKNNPKGFTLIEALVACVVLTGAWVTLSALNTRCLSRVRLNRQYDRAWQILDSQLTTIDCMGIEQFLEQDTTYGEIDDESGVTFYWQVVARPIKIDYLYLIEINVRWTDLNKTHQIFTATRLNGGAGINLARADW